jgi:hypothetical protein
MLLFVAILVLFPSLALAAPPTARSVSNLSVCDAHGDLVGHAFSLTSWGNASYEAGGNAPIWVMKLKKEGFFSVSAVPSGLLGTSGHTLVYDTTGCAGSPLILRKGFGVQDYLIAPTVVQTSNRLLVFVADIGTP